jgi:hypothetical protein
MASSHLSHSGHRPAESGWLNQCGFSCKFCSFETKIYKGFLSHISNEHKLTAKEYKDQVSML